MTRLPAPISDLAQKIREHEEAIGDIVADPANTTWEDVQKSLHAVIEAAARVAEPCCSDDRGCVMHRKMPADQEILSAWTEAHGGEQ